MNSVSTVVLSRDCDAIQIPAGNVVTLPAGTEVDITQTLGGSYTVHAMGGLFRIGPKDADALGITPSAEASTTPVTGDTDEKSVWEALRSCYDPEIPVNIVDLGLVYDCKVEADAEGKNKAIVKMTLTAPGCGMGPTIAADAQSRIMTIEEMDDAAVELCWDPPWNKDMISIEGKMKLGMI